MPNCTTCGRDSTPLLPGDTVEYWYKRKVDGADMWRRDLFAPLTQQGFKTRQNAKDYILHHNLITGMYIYTCDDPTV